LDKIKINFNFLKKLKEDKQKKKESKKREEMMLEKRI